MLEHHSLYLSFFFFVGSSAPYRPHIFFTYRVMLITHIYITYIFTAANLQPNVCMCVGMYVGMYGGIYVGMCVGMYVGIYEGM